MKTLSIVLSLILLAGTYAPLANAAQVPEPPKSDKQFQINGAGATFPFPLIDTWRVEYNKLHSNVNLNYQSIGSGGGVAAHTAKTVNFGASDAPLQPAERDLAPGTLHIPEAIGSVVLAYYLPEVPQSGLKLTGENVADIYLGKIKKWNDPKLQENNPDLKLPDRPILVTRRSDGSGTTYVFTDYLSKVSKEWNQKVGKGKSVPWPLGVGAAGNEGVAWATRNTKYAIGYVELAYATANGMTVAYLQNGDKTTFVEPTFDTVFNGAQAYPIDKIPKPQDDWSQVSMVLAPGQNSYPIVSFTYLLIYEDINQAISDKDMAKAFVNMVYWMVTDGQKFSKPLGYVPLPAAIQELDKQGLSRIKFEGEQLWSYASTAPIKVDVSIACWEWKMGESKAGKQTGARCKISSWLRIDSRSQPMQAKAASNYANAALARVEALKNGYDEAIMLNHHGKIAEGSAENIFIVRDGKIYTPPLTSGCLAGITRDSVIEIIKSDGMDITERQLERDDLYSADEIFMTGTAAEVKSVAQVDDVTISDGKMGEITKSLQKSFMDVAMGKDERFAHWLTYI